VHKTKVIFLDIDGVLNCKRTPNPRKLPYILDKRLVRIFKRVVARSRATVVLSSTWRYDPAGLFSARRGGINYVDVIPDLPNRPRRDEILTWLAKHPGVARYAVIDDDDDELDALPLFQPSSWIGLTPRIAEGVVRYLQGKTEEDMRSSPAVRLLQNLQSRLKSHPG
jgi:hypothetical protein